MKQSLILKNYTGETKEFIIDEFEHVSIITITILSGDEVATIVYDNPAYNKTYDSCEEREIDFHDEDYIIYPKEVNEFNQLKGSSYERFREVTKWRLKDSGIDW